jgi:hypothetical protein
MLRRYPPGNRQSFCNSFGSLQCWRRSDVAVHNTAHHTRYLIRENENRWRTHPLQRVGHRSHERHERLRAAGHQMLHLHGCSQSSKVSKPVKAAQFQHKICKKIKRLHREPTEPINGGEYSYDPSKHVLAIGGDYEGYRCCTLITATGIGPAFATDTTRWATVGNWAVMIDSTMVI